MKQICILLLAAILSACGGGGDLSSDFIGPPDITNPVRPNILCSNPINCQ